MEEQGYKNQEITDYLLGSLPADRAERFDELSFTDEGFAGALDNAENELLDRYARGELAGDALDKFESYYLASPLRGEKARFAETFQIYGKRKFSEQSETLASVEAKPENASGGFFSFLNFFKNRNPLPLFGFAALLLLIVGGFWLLKNRPPSETAKQDGATNVPTEQPKQTKEQPSANSNQEIAAVNSASQLPSPLPANATPKKSPNAQPATDAPKQERVAPKIIVASFVLAPSLRGSQITNLSIPKAATEIEMSLELEADDFPAYHVALTDESGSVNLGRGGKIKTVGKGENKSLNVRFPAGLLKSQIYTLVVSGINASGQAEIISNYTFRSVLK